MVDSIESSRNGAARECVPPNAMERRMHTLPTPCVLLAALAGLLAPAGPTHAQDTLTVFAAASMKNALDDVDAAYTRKTGTKGAVSYAASSALMKQIEQGAPADVFISADLDWMDYGSQKKVIEDATRVNLLGNRIVLIAPKDSRLADVPIGPGFDLATPAGGGRRGARRGAG